MIIGILFFIFGLITWVNSVLIPFFKTVCELTDAQAYLVAFAFYIAYFVMAIPSSKIIKRFGYSKSMTLGLVAMSIGAFCFVPAAYFRHYLIFLIGLFIQGIGLALLQTAANPYVTLIGPIKSAARRISIMGICNKVAGMIGVFLLSSALFGKTSHLVERLSVLDSINHLNPDEIFERTQLLEKISNSIMLPYIIVGITFILLAILISSAHLPELQENEEEHCTENKPIQKYHYMWLGVFALFVYVGAEVIAIDTLVMYGKHLNFEISIASNFPIYALIALTVGYLLSIVLVPKLISQRYALIIQTIIALILTIIVVVTPSRVSITALILINFTHAIMWPAIWPLSLDGLGKHTKTASAFLIMAIAGGAVLPLIFGKLSDIFTQQYAYLILIPLYLFILFFAIFGYKIGKNYK